MGCTSSAPSMAPANATDKNITSDDVEDKPMEDIMETIGGVTETKAIIENKVLPTCDNLDEPIVISQTDKSMLGTECRRIDKDVQTDSFRIENSWSECFKIQEEDKASKLEEVVEKAVEMLGSDSNTESARNTPEEPDKVTDKTDTEDASEEPAAADSEPEEENYEHLEEAISPSQSESSRATRWEALADIAAELPPSLTVDPLTGQIYALSK